MHKRITINSSSNNLLYISSSLIEEGFSPSLHSHPNLEVILITEGEGYIVSTNRKIPVKARDIVIINPNSMHYESNLGLRYYAIGVRNIEVFTKNTFTKKIIVQELSHYDYSLVNSMYNIMYDESRKNLEDSELIINSSYNILFSFIKRYYTIISNDFKDKNESNLVSSIKAIIDNYYYTEISLDDLAHRLSLSKSTLCHVFKEETGQSIIDYKISKELDEACNLLKISDMSITAIALQVGFNNTSYFTKVFKERYNLTPRQYKELSKKQKVK